MARLATLPEDCSQGFRGLRRSGPVAADHHVFPWGIAVLIVLSQFRAFSADDSGRSRLRSDCHPVEIATLKLDCNSVSVPCLFLLAIWLIAAPTLRVLGVNASTTSLSNMELVYV